MAGQFCFGFSDGLPIAIGNERVVEDKLYIKIENLLIGFKLLLVTFFPSVKDVL